MVQKSKLEKYKKEARREQRADGEPRLPVASRLKPETKHGIYVVLLFTLAIVTTFSLFGWAGQFGEAVRTVLLYVFGWGKIAVPLILFIIGYLLVRPQQYSFRLANGIGLGLLFLSGTGFLHLVGLPLAEATSAISSGRGGGYVGLLLSYPLESVMGPWATGVILLAVFLISLMVMFDVSLKRMYEQGNFMARIGERFREFFYKLRLNMNRSDDVDDADGAAIDDTVEDMASDETAAPPSFQVSSVADTTGESTPATTASAAESQEQIAMFAEEKKRKRKIDIPIDLLESSAEKPTSGDIEKNKETIYNTFKNFGINVEMGETKVGPTVTQFTLKPDEGVKLAQITTLGNDLALALAAHPIRIEAPIPGKSLVGIEVPNKAVAVVKLKEILMSKEFKKRKSNLAIGIGKDVSGSIWIEDIGPMPHLLIAGSTGSGKSVMLNAIILSLLYQNSPDDLKLILVDPKRVELSIYNGIPHLITPVVNEVDKTINALRWVVGEMDRRYQLLSKTGHRNIGAYNRDNGNMMPYLVVAIDELADLMSVAANEVEAAIVRLAQMARAVGIHLILATQRPSVDIITGLIKANITTRIAFAVASQIDSRTILDTGGAEKLLGRGDMLYTSSQLSKPRRLQGAFISDDEINRVVAYLKSKGQPEYQEEVVKKVVDRTLIGSFDDMGDDELVGQAKDIVVKAGKASASFLQRRLRIGYARAARLLDILEEQGVIGPGDGAKPREILVSRSGMTDSFGDDEFPAGEETDADEETETDETEEAAADEETDETDQTDDERA
ncbi:MAG: DNA translocase FtsK 4TM domain-containing protein [Candidatus Kerfeldbacteria bacterium]|nr:DNA translocase FtsK 4TM domain-containing protein [Candidatus Kerfeldbacteria bacterium]